jgi:hypothetical protein
MAFVTDKAELKPGLIVFRRGDVDHRMWYCRMKIPKADRYKTVSLKTTDIEVARERAFDQDADIRFRLKHDVPCVQPSLPRGGERVSVDAGGAGETRRNQRRAAQEGSRHYRRRFR